MLRAPLSPIAALVAAALLAACGGGAPRPETQPATAPAGAAGTAPAPKKLTGPDGNRRLGKDVVPLRYTLDLTIDPAKDRFRGVSTITATVFSPTKTVALHGEGMTFERAVARVGESERAARVEPGPHGGLALHFDEDLPAGGVTFELTYEAPLPEVPMGLYRVQDGDHWYAFTQFEPLAARRAFPCFDQPEFKTPYRVTLRVPKGQLALTNGPEKARKDEGAHTVYTFAETRPLPTYLVAFAVGPFDVAEAPADAIPGVPFRIIATKGKGHLAQFAIDRTPAILATLSRYFDQPYPFAKLDMVAVPNFGAGAMENVGLVTYRERLLLLDPEQATARDRYWSQAVIAHELAHMWFGNLVTPAWWDDLWLNEAFASWMATRVLTEVDPALEADLDAVSDKGRVMKLDAQAHARAIRQPIEHGGDVFNAFDGITYGEGEAVLHMLERWVGPEAFRRGVREYMSAHAYGSATTADLVVALERATGKPVGETARRFLDLPGTPLVNAELTCAKERGRPATLKLSQTRYRPAGSEAPVGEPWRVPVCVRYGLDGEAARECFVLDAPEKTVTLGRPGCPTWVHPNADEDGCYRWSLPDAALLDLLTRHRAALTLRERVALPGTLEALLEADVLGVEAFLDGLAELAKEDHRLVVSGVIGALGTLHHAAVDDELRPAFAAYVQRLLGPHAERIGLEPRPDDGVDARLLRPELVGALASMGAHEGVRARGREVVEQYLADPTSVPGSLVEQYLAIGAWGADEALWTRLRDALPKAPTPAARVAVIRALGSVDDPALLKKSLQLVLDGTLRAQDFRTVRRGSGRLPETRRAAWDWMTAHYDRLVERLGEERAPYLPWLGAGFCDAEARERVESFFSAPERAPAGTARNLGLALETIDRCIRLRAATRDALATRLARGHR